MQRGRSLCLLDRFAERGTDPAAFSRLDQLHASQPHVIPTASLVHSLGLSQDDMKLVDQHVLRYVKEALMNARYPVVLASS